MSQKVTTTVTCDLDSPPHKGREADGAATVPLPGGRELDLCPAHAERLAAALAPYVAVARLAATADGRVIAMHRTRKPKDSNGTSGKVREWARANNIKVPDRGRIPRDVLQQYVTGSTATM
jgi:Lsr2